MEGDEAVTAQPPPNERRRAWTIGPEHPDGGESWRHLDDDALLAGLAALGPGHGADLVLLEIVSSNRHFFVRQAAALALDDPAPLRRYADDRHLGQILARRLSRVEDLVYLRALAQDARHAEVRRAAEAQLKELQRRLGARPGETPAAATWQGLSAAAAALTGQNTRR